MPSVPVPAPQAAEMMQSYAARHFLQYYPILAAPRGADLRARFRQDARIAALEGKMFSHGLGAVSFSFEHFCMWYLWLEDEFGQAVAGDYLEKFLTEEMHPVLVTEWILGIRVEQTLSLGDGFEIRPVSAMPPSQDQEQFSRVPGPLQYHASLAPTAAITKTCPIKIVRAMDDRSLSDALKATTVQLGRLPVLINAIEGLSCLPRFSTSYAPASVPNGPFTGGGGGIPGYDVIGTQVHLMTPAHGEQLTRIAHTFATKPESEQQRLLIVLHRLCQAKRHERIQDKVLDLGIALEMLLLNDNASRDQLSQSFRLRGGWLLAQNAEERTHLHDAFKDIYRARSEVAHGGQLAWKSDIRERHTRLAEWLDLACRVFQRILSGGTPNWTALVLGGEGFPRR
jgi:hypothetical protein